MSNKAERGPLVNSASRTAKEAVAFFDAICRKQNWVFAEVRGQDDIGKDGYLDFTVGDEASGLCVAVQVKGGASYRRKDGYIFRSRSKSKVLWRDSTIPVFGILWDPPNLMYWINLTEYVNRNGVNSPIRMSRENELDGEGITKFLDAAWKAAIGAPAVVALGSDEEPLQTAAVWDCYGLGRRDEKYLVLLRRVMFGLHPVALDFAIEVLNTCSLNMDVFKTSDWMSTEQRQIVRKSFDWTVDEAVTLLGRVNDSENGYFGRTAYFGSCVYWLIVGSEPRGEKFVRLTENAVYRALSEGNLHAAAMGLMLWLYWLQDGAADALHIVLRRHPQLLTHEAVPPLVEAINTFGYFEI